MLPTVSVRVESAKTTTDEGRREPTGLAHAAENTITKQCPGANCQHGVVDGDEMYLPSNLFGNTVSMIFFLS